jgi:hypothetical protein
MRVSEFERICKDMVMATSHYYPDFYLEGLKKSTKNIIRNISRDSLCPRYIRTEYVPDTITERYRCVNLLGSKCYTVDRQPGPPPPIQPSHDFFKCSGASLKLNDKFKQKETNLSEAWKL